MPKTTLCVVCGDAFTPPRKGAKCCSRACWALRGGRKCREAGCGEPSLAKGLCRAHYRKERYRAEGPPAPVAKACVVCGNVVMRSDVKGRRTTCSRKCYNDLRGWKTMTELAPRVTHRFPSPRLIRLAQPKPAQQSRVRFVATECLWCGARFLFDMRVTGSLAKQCSAKCTKAAAKHRYRLRYGQFSISPRDRQAIYDRDGWICQLCGNAISKGLHHSDDWAPSLDHIECQSWSLVPDHSPKNLRTVHRLCNSLRGDESWAPSVEMRSDA